jgi:protein-S-isoprenylcysteine O-methyltransferase Ste14
VLVACVTAGWLVTALYATEVPRAAIGGPPIAFVLGLVAAWSGIALGWSAFHVLGELFTFHVTTSADQPVIDSGPYRVLRHPGYTGIALVLIGMGLLYGNWIGVAAIGPPDIQTKAHPAAESAASVATPRTPTAP